MARRLPGRSGGRGQRPRHGRQPDPGDPLDAPAGWIGRPRARRHVPDARPGHVDDVPARRAPGRLPRDRRGRLVRDRSVRLGPGGTGEQRGGPIHALVARASRPVPSAGRGDHASECGGPGRVPLRRVRGAARRALRCSDRERLQRGVGDRRDLHGDDDHRRGDPVGGTENPGSRVPADPRRHGPPARWR